VRKKPPERPAAAGGRRLVARFTASVYDAGGGRAEIEIGVGGEPERPLDQLGLPPAMRAGLPAMLRLINPAVIEAAATAAAGDGNAVE
jgi:hypothetical protein